MELQGGQCALCPATDRLEVDHDHWTGLVRGLLCRGCNISEGQTRRPSDAVKAYRTAPPAAHLDYEYPGWIAPAEIPDDVLIAMGRARKWDPDPPAPAKIRTAPRRRNAGKQAPCAPADVIAMGRARKWQPE
jgi:hypothetical protein